jgi:C1A family cysteine protease
MTTKRFGWKKQLPDFRDFRLPPRNKLVRLPSSVDLRPAFPPVYDQGELGSCTANAIAAALDYERGKQGMPFITPSRLFLYFNERTIENTVDYDAGADLRDGIKSVAQMGDCPESSWPYDIAQFAVKPSDAAYLEAEQYKSVLYHAVTQDLLSLKSALAEKLPVIFGFTVYDSFLSDEVTASGMVQMPGADEQLQGGHAVVMVGYDDAKQSVLVRNSWSDTWGIGGHFWLPYSYAINPDLSSDWWVISTVLQDAPVPSTAACPKAS